MRAPARPAARRPACRRDSGPGSPRPWPARVDESPRDHAPTLITVSENGINHSQPMSGRVNIRISPARRPSARGIPSYWAWTAMLRSSGSYSDARSASPGPRRAPTRRQRPRPARCSRRHPRRRNEGSRLPRRRPLEKRCSSRTATPHARRGAEDLVEPLPQDLERLGRRRLHRGLEIGILLGAALGRTEAGAPLPDESGAAIASSAPSARRTSLLHGSCDSPIWKRGNRSRSSTTTLLPRRVSAVAALEPPGPPPTTATSKSHPLLVMPRGSSEGRESARGYPEGGLRSIENDIRPHDAASSAMLTSPPWRGAWRRWI